jgi:hypothetical protein
MRLASAGDSIAGLLRVCSSSCAQARTQLLLLLRSPASAQQVRLAVVSPLSMTDPLRFQLCPFHHGAPKWHKPPIVFRAACRCHPDTSCCRLKGISTGGAWHVSCALGGLDCFPVPGRSLPHWSSLTVGGCCRRTGGGTRALGAPTHGITHGCSGSARWLFSTDTISALGRPQANIHLNVAREGSAATDNPPPMHGMRTRAYGSHAYSALSIIRADSSRHPHQPTLDLKRPPRPTLICL